MKKLIIIFASIFLGHFTALTQNDSITTLILQKIDAWGKPKEKIINPLKKNTIWTNKNRKIVIDSLRICNNKVIITVNDSISISDIDKIKTRGKLNAGKIIIGSLVEIIGSATVLTGIIVFNLPVGTMDGDDTMGMIRANHTNGFLIGLAGSGIIFSGFKILQNSKYDTKNNWILKSGQYYYRK